MLPPRWHWHRRNRSCMLAQGALERRSWKHCPTGSASLHPSPTPAAPGPQESTFHPPQAAPSVIKQAPGVSLENRLGDAGTAPKAQHLLQFLQQDLPGKAHSRPLQVAPNRIRQEQLVLPGEHGEPERHSLGSETVLSLEPKPKKVSKWLCPKHKQGDCSRKEKTDTGSRVA